MAENQEQSNRKEKEIPVFTVLKNNCILKNIFLLDNPPSLNPSSISAAENADQGSETEEILVVGRHPDCSIKLEHPSISRFHLRIHSKPSSRSIFVTDLSSAHGTWISGNRIEPEVKTQLNEGDTLTLGASSRLYRLNWVPLSRAYDIDNPFVPQLDVGDTIEEETEEAMMDQENNCSSYENDRVQTLSDEMEGIDQLLSEEDLCSSMQEINSAVPLIPEEIDLSDNQMCRFEKKVVTQLETMEISEMNSEIKSGLNIWSRRGKAVSVGIETGRNRGNGETITMDLQVESIVDENYNCESIIEDHYSSFVNNEEIFTPDKENESIPKASICRLDMSDEEELYTPDKENMTPKSHMLKSVKVGKLKEIFTPDKDEEEIFTSDKENMTPKSHLLRSKKVGKSEVKQPKLYRSSPLKTIDCGENQHREVLQTCHSTSSASKSRRSLKKQPAVLKERADRDPFRPLPMNSISNHKAKPKPSVHEETMKDIKTINYPEFEEINPSHHNTMKVDKKKWMIVADTSCLMNKKSRRELQLMRGLPGTTLVIPRIVVRELDCLLRHGSFFTRTTEVSAALQWIEDTMSVSKAWIHVQSSAEECSLIPPTPPAHRFCEGNNGIFSPYSLQEVVTPTAADHILESALFFKRTRNDGQLVILSDDVTLKIKAMAEGVICETAEEFRGSLVSPFSERFLYAESSPVGPTWSGVDDAVLKERYYPSSLKRQSKSGEVSAKGLKLVLLHNSSFRQITPLT
ncbi:hypothetical protein ACP275_03G116200 [Erythranthe tilingii]